MAQKDIKFFKLTSLPLAPEKDAIYYILDADTGKVKTYITDLNGAPRPLVDFEGVTSITNSDGSVTITGTVDEPVISISADMQALINGALQSGDNISELVNDVSFITIADVENRIKPINIGAFSGNEIFPMLYVAEAINSSAAVVVGANEIPLFQAIFTAVPMGQGETSKIYKRIYGVTTGKGTYGVGGDIIIDPFSNTIILISSELLTEEPPLTNDPNAINIDLGEIAGGDFITAINTQPIPYYYITNPIENWYFTFTDGGLKKIYAFQGILGVYGSGQLQTIPSDFFLIYDEGSPQPANPTNTSELVNDGADGINPFITALAIDKTYVDALNVDADTLDGNDSTAFQLVSAKDQNNGYAGLDANGKISTSTLPPLAITSVVTATENTLALFAAASAGYTFEQGDVIIVTTALGDIEHYIYKGGTKTDVNEYSEINSSQIDWSQIVNIPALDADTLDGNDTSYFLDSDNHTTPTTEATTFTDTDKFTLWVSGVAKYLTGENLKAVLNSLYVTLGTAQTITAKKTFTTLVEDAIDINVAAGQKGVLLTLNDYAFGVYVDNNSLGIAVALSNNDVGTAQYINNYQGGIGHYINNASTGFGHFIQNVLGGTGQEIDNRGSGVAYDANGITASTGKLYRGKKDGVETFSINKEGDIIANTYTGKAIYNASLTGAVNFDLNTFEDGWFELDGDTTVTLTNTPAVGYTIVKSFYVKSKVAQTFSIAGATYTDGVFLNDGTVNRVRLKVTNFATVGLKIEVKYDRTYLQVTGVTLTAASWVLVSGLYEYDYSNTLIKSDSVVDVIPDNSTIDIVKAADVLPKTVSSAGSVKLYSTNLPTDDIVVNFNIIY